MVPTWQYFSTLICDRLHGIDTEVGPLLNANGLLVIDKRSMSEILLKQFSSVFSTTPSANHAIHDIPSFFHDNDQINSNLNPKLTDITRESVEAAIKSLKANSAPGPDGMTSELLSKKDLGSTNIPDLSGPLILN